MNIPLSGLVLPLWALCLCGLVPGCTTSLDVVASPAATEAAFTSAYIVSHDENAGPMCGRIQRALLGRGLEVGAGNESDAPAGVDLIVRYGDSWRWDVVMYLRSFDLEVYDARTRMLLAAGHWKNSALHGFPNADKVVDDVVQQTFDRLGKSHP